MDLRYDVIIKGGLVVDPSQRLEGKMDVAISGGRIAAVDDEIDPDKSDKVIDASNKLVTPGLVDLHTHVYWGVAHWSVEPDPTCLAKGVTTVVDAGTSGALTFPGFRRYVIENSNTRVLALLHISSIGLTQHPKVGDLQDLRSLDFDCAVNVAKRNSDVIKGVKIRVDKDNVGQNGPQALRLAKEAARSVGVPLMIHISGVLPDNLSLPEILSIIEKGDVVTHCLPPPFPPSTDRSVILNRDGEVIPEVKEARRRGVLFDVGHGSGSFSWETAEKVLNQGFVPDMISSDLHAYSLNGPVYDLATVLSKFLFLGLSLSKVVELSTFAPASFLKFEDRIGTLKPGSEADVAIFSLESGKFPYYDNSQNPAIGLRGDVMKEKIIDKRLEVFRVIKSGRIVP